MRSGSRDKVFEIVATLLEIDAAEVSDETGPDTHVQWDSLNHLNVCTAVSQEFGIEILTDEMAAIQSVADLLKLLEGKV